MVLASLAALERSHRRHDEVIAELLEGARRLAAGRADSADLRRVHDAVAYFEREVTRHFVDEDGSVFPRLSTRRPALAAPLAELSAEHPTQITLQSEVAAAARELEAEPRPSAGKTLLDAATKLAAAHHAHVGREDEIFARAHEALTADDDREIVAEMETRRGREDHGRLATTRDDARATTPRSRPRATGATTTLTTRRGSVAARSSAKRGPATPVTPARAASKPAASKPTTRASSKPAPRAASKPAARASSKAASKPVPRAASKPAPRAASTPANRTIARRPATRSGAKR